MHRFPFGNNLGMVLFVRKVPPYGGDQTRIAPLLAKLTDKQGV